MKWVDLQINRLGNFGVKISADNSEVLTYIAGEYSVSFLVSEIFLVFVAAKAGLPIPDKVVRAKIHQLRDSRPSTQYLTMEASTIDAGTSVFAAYQELYFTFVPSEIDAILSYLEDRKVVL